MTIQEIHENIKNAMEISECIGCDKPILYCEKEISKLESLIKAQKERIDSIKNLGLALYQAGETKEKDWALHGGIANGLAGGAAGLATALDIQHQNEQARINNEQLRQETALFVSNALSGQYEPIHEYENRIKKLRNKIEAHKHRQIKRFPEIDLLEKLNPCMNGWQLTNSNIMEMTVKVAAVKIDIGLSKKKAPKKATIDGSFKALIVNSADEVINEIFFNLPYNGATKESELTGYSINMVEENKICKIIFVPVNLWGIETGLDVETSSNVIRVKYSKTEVAKFWEKDILKQKKILSEHFNTKITEIESEYALTIKECICGIVGVLGIIVGIICLPKFIKYGMSFSDIAITLLTFALGAILLYISKIEITDNRYAKASEIAKCNEDNEKKMNLLSKQLEEIKHLNEVSI